MSKRVCKRCKQPIGRGHRWHKVRRAFLWFWTLEWEEHHNCHSPEMGPGPRRLPGEVTLPFMAEEDEGVSEWPIS